jgi:hypothetical protein
MQKYYNTFLYQIIIQAIIVIDYTYLYGAINY